MNELDAMATLWSRFQAVHDHLAGQINRALYRETGLSEADAAVLIALLDTPASQLHSFELRCGLAWEKSRLSHQLRRMESRGLIERAACPDDARSSLIHLTPAGEVQARAARRVLSGAIHQSLEGALTEDQLAQLAVMTDAIVQYLERRNPAAV